MYVVIEIRFRLVIEKKGKYKDKINVFNVPLVCCMRFETVLAPR